MKRCVKKISQNGNLSVGMKAYFEDINESLQEIYTVASQAREKGLDPSLEVEIPIANVSVQEYISINYKHKP